MITTKVIKKNQISKDGLIKNGVQMVDILDIRKRMMYIDQTVRINNKTPTTFNELTKSLIEANKREKQKQNEQKNSLIKVRNMFAQNRK
jgi:hypothetical protein